MLIDGIDLDLTGLRVMPGLINAHDHLEFALFPRLGSGPYRNAAEWARDIYRPNEAPVRNQLEVPKRVRLLWGGLRNLIAGVTTVCHHNPYDPVFDDGFPVRVLRNIGWAHSLHFTSDLAAAFRLRARDWPFVLHAGEGTDAAAAGEVHRLHDLGVLGPRTVLVHAVGFDAGGWQLIERAGAGIVWCLRSNMSLFGATLDIDDLIRRGIPIALGTDSPLTADGDLLDEIRAAAAYCAVRDIKTLVTSGASRVLRTGTGGWIAAKDFGDQPELVVVEREVQLVGARLAGKARLSPNEWFPLLVEGREPVYVRQNVPDLIRASRESLRSDDICLGGRKVLQ